MSRPLPFYSLLFFLFFGLALPSPAPLIYRPGEGWSYEKVGDESNWRKGRAKDQLELAQVAYDKKNYDTALKAAKRVVKQWPLSDYAGAAQYLVGRCYEAKDQDEKAFQAYQTALEKHPKIENYQEILKRQYEIANRYLGGQWFKLWGVVPFFPNMNKTAAMYEKVIKNGPYSDVAPQAQLNIGSAREKKSEFPAAVKAYERAADRYNDQKSVAADAIYKAGMASFKQAKTSEYDQNVSAQAISTFTDFMTLHPDDARVPEAKKIISQLRTEQARGSLEIARYYERKNRYDGALIYYNEVILKDPNSRQAGEAQQRIEALKKRAK